ncbi:MAG: hypothetical protein AAB967_03680, partial [Patescibacteria group bacterium]
KITINAPGIAYHKNILMYNMRMGNIVETALLWIASHPALKFGTIGAITEIQGESGVLIGTLLIRRGEIKVWEFLSVVIAVILAYESLVYLLGRALRNTPLGTLIEQKIKRHEKIEKALNENAPKTLALSRLVIYLSLAVVFLSGWMRVNYFQFVRYRFVGIITWLGIMTPFFLLFAYSVGGRGEEWVIREIFSAALIIVIFLFGIKHAVIEWLGFGGEKKRRRFFRRKKD